MSRVSLLAIAREWGRIGCIGFGGPPAHIRLLRQAVVDRRGWITASEYEDGLAVVNLLPGPASTQLAIYSAWLLRGVPGAVVGGVAFIVPGLVIILALAAVFLASHPPLALAGAAAGAGAAVPAVALQAAVGLIPPSRARARSGAGRLRWLGYLAAGGVGGAVAGPWLALVLVGAGLTEVTRRGQNPWRAGSARASALSPLFAAAVPAAGGLAALAWVAFKVGALSYGGGFVIVPLMQRDAVHVHHWMRAAQFLDAVALGQVTPGPVVQTVAVVGYAAAGVGGGLLAALFAFGPSFLLVCAGAPHFAQLRGDARVQAFLTGAGAAAIGAIAGSAIPLSESIGHLWQGGILALAATWLIAARRGVVSALAGCAALGVGAALLGAPL